MLTKGFLLCKSLKITQSQSTSGLLVVNSEGRSAFSSAMGRFKNFIYSYNFGDLRKFFVVPKKVSNLVGLDQAKYVPRVKLVVSSPVSHLK